jgi:PhnB protein
MKEINAYLTFNGTCRQAMQFYQSCLGGDLQAMPFSSAPMKVPEGAENLIIHARLASGDGVLMASDAMPGMPYHPGNNFWVSLTCASAEETEKLFTAFSANAKIVMPVQETFWAVRFGMLTDQFGVNWMFNFSKPQPQ